MNMMPNNSNNNKDNGNNHNNTKQYDNHNNFVKRCQAPLQWRLVALPA